jgi:hypothetical protein
MAVTSAGLEPKNDCSGNVQKQLYSKLQTRPLVRKGATKQQTLNSLKKISRRKKNCSRVPDGCPTPRQAGRQTIGRKLTSTSTSPRRTVETMMVGAAGDLRLSLSRSVSFEI